MISYQEVVKLVPTTKVLKISCDWCGKEAHPMDKTIISFSVGFPEQSQYEGQIFSFDICPECFKEHLESRSTR